MRDYRIIHVLPEKRCRVQDVKGDSVRTGEVLDVEDMRTGRRIDVHFDKV